MEQRFDLEEYKEGQATELGPLRPPWVATTPVTTGKGGKGDKGKHRGKGETRQRSAAAVERRLLRGAARRAETWLKEGETEGTGQCKRPRREELDYVEALRLQSVPESAVPEFLNERNTVQGGPPTWGSTHGASQRGVCGEGSKGSFRNSLKWLAPLQGDRHEEPTLRKKVDAG